VAGAELRSGLTMNVQVLVTGQKEVDEKNRRISESGFVTLPLVGDVQVAGFTVAKAQTVLQGSYSRFFVAPQVIVECLMESGDAAVSPWGHVTVLGRVKRPGQVNMPPTRELTVSRAIQLAGGLDTSARSGAIRVTRTCGDTTEHFDVNLNRIGESGISKHDIQLMPGDIVYVPEAAL
jgi:polysaccharide export outer membrane protein